jgi:hypothetical protein
MPKYKPATSFTAALACYNRSIVFLAEYLHCRTRRKYAMQVRVQKWGKQPGGSDSQALAQDAEVEEELV